jgi:hypothetical protein
MKVNCELREKLHNLPGTNIFSSNRNSKAAKIKSILNVRMKNERKHYHEKIAVKVTFDGISSCFCFSKIFCGRIQ